MFLVALSKTASALRSSFSSPLLVVGATNAAGPSEGLEPKAGSAEGYATGFSSDTENVRIVPSRVRELSFAFLGNAVFCTLVRARDTRDTRGAQQHDSARRKESSGDYTSCRVCL